MEKMQDKEVRPKINNKTNDTKKAVNQEQPEPNDLNKNNKRVRELELVELFRSSLDPKVDIFANTGLFQLNISTTVSGNRTGRC